MDNLPTEQPSVQPVTPTSAPQPAAQPAPAATPAPTPVPQPPAQPAATSAAPIDPGTLPPPSSSKTIFIVVAAVIALVLAYLGYAMMSAPSTATQEDEISAAPPSLSVAKSALKGAFNDTDPMYNCMKFTEEEGKNYKPPVGADGKTAKYAELEGNVLTPVATIKKMTWKEAALSLDPVGGRICMAFYDPTVKKFKIYPKGPFDGTVTMQEPQFSTEYIESGRGGFIISGNATRAYNFASAKTIFASADVTALDPNLEGWIFHPATKETAGEELAQFKGRNPVMFVQKSKTEFEKVTDMSKKLNSFIYWVYLKKSAGGVSGGGSTDTTKTTTIKSNTLKAITLNATGITTTQTQDVTLEGENLDNVGTITSSDPGILVKSIDVTSTKVTFKIEVGSSTKDGEKTITLNGKDGKLITTLTVKASTPTTPVLTLPALKITLPINESKIDVTKDVVLAWDAAATLPVGTTALYLTNLMDGAITADNFKPAPPGTTTANTSITTKAADAAQIFLPGKSYTFGVKVSAIDSTSKPILTSNWSLVTFSVAAAAATATIDNDKITPKKITIPTGTPTLTTIQGTLTGTNLSAVSKIISTDTDLNVIVEKAEATSVTFKITHTKLTAGEKTFTAYDKDDKVIITFKIQTDPPGASSPKPVITAKNVKEKDAQVTFTGTDLDKDPAASISCKSNDNDTKLAWAKDTTKSDAKSLVFNATYTDTKSKVNKVFVCTLKMKDLDTTNTYAEFTYNVDQAETTGPVITLKTATTNPSAITFTSPADKAVLKIEDLQKNGLTFKATDPNKESYNERSAKPGTYYMNYKWSLQSTTAPAIWSAGWEYDEAKMKADPKCQATFAADSKNYMTCPDGKIPASVFTTGIPGGVYTLTGEVGDGKNSTLTSITITITTPTYRDLARVIDLGNIKKAIDASYTANKQYPDDVATTFAIPSSLTGVQTEDSQKKPYYYHNMENKCYVLGALMETKEYGNTGLPEGDTIDKWIGTYKTCDVANSLVAKSGPVLLIFKNAPATVVKSLILKTAEEAPRAPENVKADKDNYSIDQLKANGLSFSFTDKNESSYLEDRDVKERYLVNYRFAITTQNDDPENTPWKSEWESGFPTGDAKCTLQVINHADSNQDATVWTCTKGTIKVADTSKFKNATYVLHVWAGDGSKESKAGESQIFEVTGVPAE